MPQVDFSKPMTFTNALEKFALILNCAMVALRNESIMTMGIKKSLMPQQFFHPCLKTLTLKQ